MDYWLYFPDARLSPYVKCYWSLVNETENASRERIFPDGCIELIFHSGDLFKKYDSATAFHIQPRSFIHGQLTKFIEVEPTGDSHGSAEYRKRMAGVMARRALAQCRPSEDRG